MCGAIRILERKLELGGALMIDSIDWNLSVIRHGGWRPQGKQGEQEYANRESHAWEPIIGNRCGQTELQHPSVLERFCAVRWKWVRRMNRLLRSKLIFSLFSQNPIVKIFLWAVIDNGIERIKCWYPPPPSSVVSLLSVFLQNIAVLFISNAKCKFL